MERRAHESPIDLTVEEELEEEAAGEEMPTVTPSQSTRQSPAARYRNTTMLQYYLPRPRRVIIEEPMEIDVEEKEEEQQEKKDPAIKEAEDVYRRIKTYMEKRDKEIQEEQGEDLLRIQTKREETEAFIKSLEQQPPTLDVVSKFVVNRSVQNVQRFTNAVQEEINSKRYQKYEYKTRAGYAKRIATQCERPRDSPIVLLIFSYGPKQQKKIKLDKEDWNTILSTQKDVITPPERRMRIIWPQLSIILYPEKKAQWDPIDSFLETAGLVKMWEYVK